MHQTVFPSSYSDFTGFFLQVCSDYIYTQSQLKAAWCNRRLLYSLEKSGLMLLQPPGHKLTSLTVAALLQITSRPVVKYVNGSQHLYITVHATI